MSNIELGVIQPYLITIFLVLARVSGLLVMMPFIGTQLVASRTKVILLISLTFIFVVRYDGAVDIDVFSFQMIIAVLGQFLLGLIISLTFNIVLQIMIFAGEMIAMQAGLGMATMNDPITSSNMPMISEFYYLISLLFFFSLDVHLEILNILATSFTEIPLHIKPFSAEFCYDYVLIGRILYSFAFKIALPIVSVLLLMQFALGIMTKTAPQLNIFSIGFPLMIMLGLVLIALNLDTLKYHFVDFISYAINLLDNHLFVKG